MLTSPLFVTVQKGLAMRCALRAEGRVRASGTYSTSRPSRQARPRPSAPAKKSGTAKAIPDFFRKRATDLPMRCTPRSTPPKRQSVLGGPYRGPNPSIPAQSPAHGINPSKSSSSAVYSPYAQERTAPAHLTPAPNIRSKPRHCGKSSPFPTLSFPVLAGVCFLPP